MHATPRQNSCLKLLYSACFKEPPGAAALGVRIWDAETEVQEYGVS